MKRIINNIKSIYKYLTFLLLKMKSTISVWIKFDEEVIIKLLKNGNFQISRSKFSKNLISINFITLQLTHKS